MTRRIAYVFGIVAAIAVLSASALPSRAYDNPPTSQEEQADRGQQFDADGAVVPGEESASPQRKAAAQRPQYDAQGKKLEPGDAVPKAAFKGAATTACLQLHNGSGVTWNITVTFDPNTYPFNITGGSIKGTICNSPNWKVTGGSMGPTLTIKATQPAAGGCATSVTIVGNFQNPPSYRGTYGFNGASTTFKHTTLFLGYSPFPCP